MGTIAELHPSGGAFVNLDEPAPSSERSKARTTSIGMEKRFGMTEVEPRQAVSIAYVVDYAQTAPTDPRRTMVPYRPSPCA